MSGPEGRVEERQQHAEPGDANEQQRAEVRRVLEAITERGLQPVQGEARDEVAEEGGERQTRGSYGDCRTGAEVPGAPTAPVLPLVPVPSAFVPPAPAGPTVPGVPTPPTVM